MKFIHITDLHLVPAGRRSCGVSIPMRAPDLCLDDIVKYHCDAKFCAISGDLANRGEPASYAALKERLERFPLRVHLMLGNHDDRGNFPGVFNGPDDGGFVQHRLVLDGQHFPVS